MAELWYLKKFSCLMQGHEELTSANFRFYNFIVTHHDAWTAAFSIRRNTVLIMIVIHTRLIREDLGYSTAPVVVVDAVWQYSHHVLAGLRTHEGPILTVANFAGDWPGLVSTRSTPPTSPRRWPGSTATTRFPSP